MTSIFIAAFAVFAVAFLGLSLGWLVAEKRLKGSCGGLNGGGCAVCERPCEERLRREREQEAG